MAALLELADELCADATFTLETMEPENDVHWLLDNGLLK